MISISNLFDSDGSESPSGIKVPFGVYYVPLDEDVSKEILKKAQDLNKLPLDEQNKFINRIHMMFNSER